MKDTKNHKMRGLKFCNWMGCYEKIPFYGKEIYCQGHKEKIKQEKK